MRGAYNDFACDIDLGQGRLLIVGETQPYLNQSLGNNRQGLHIKAYTRHGRQSLEERAVVRHRHLPHPLLADPLSTLQPVHMLYELMGEGCDYQHAKANVTVPGIFPSQLEILSRAKLTWKS